MAQRSKLLVRFDKRPNLEVSDLCRTRQLESVRYYLSYILWLKEKLRMVQPTFFFIQSLHSRRSSAPRVHAQNTHAFSIDLLSQAVSHGLERVLGGGEETGVGPRLQTLGGIDEHDLALSNFQQR